MAAHFADRLEEACRAKGNSLCVGLDPRWDLLPLELRPAQRSPTTTAQAFEAFCLRVLDVVGPLVPIVKPQSAFFEACGPAGMSALQKVLDKARKLDLLVILDSKRNDIASTAQAYAEAVFGGADTTPIWPADAMTVNPYLGRDAVEPFLNAARRAGGGLFLLVRTSNPGAGLFQDLLSGKMPVYRHVGQAVTAWSNENPGQCGFGDVGAVVGATHPAELAELRAALPNVPFLVPGYGAQGGSAADTAAAFRPDGTGAVINSSRGILAAFAPQDAAWVARIQEATEKSINELRAATPMKHLRP